MTHCLSSVWSWRSSWLPYAATASTSTRKPATQTVALMAGLLFDSEVFGAVFLIGVDLCVHLDLDEGGHFPGHWVITSSGARGIAVSEDCSDLEDAAQEPPTYGLARRVDSVVHCVQPQSGRESPSLQAPVTRAVSTEATDRERAPLVGRPYAVSDGDARWRRSDGFVGSAQLSACRPRCARARRRRRRCSVRPLAGTS